ncbi:MAG: ABC transporter permease [Candidatus Methanomethyliaceae archaeon]
MTRTFIKALQKNKLALSGTFILALLIIAAIFSPALAPHDPYAMNLERILSPPCREFLLGTDNLGRDLLSRLMYGTRVTLGTATCIVLITGAFGTLLGTLAGYIGGLFDLLVMRVVDILMGLPVMLIALGLFAVLGPSLKSVIVILASLTWTDFARLARGGTLSLKETDYILAAKSYGASLFHIIFLHIIPNNMAPIIVMGTLRMAYTILTLSGLSYLGFGVQPPTPDWGNIVSVGQEYLLVSPWMAFFGGFFISVTILSLNFVGDALRDALDPRQRGRFVT